MHPKFAAKQWGVLKHRQKTACETIYALLLAVDGGSPRSFIERAGQLDKVRDAAKTLAAMESLSPRALRSSAKVTQKLTQALKFVARMEFKQVGARRGGSMVDRMGAANPRIS